MAGGMMGEKPERCKNGEHIWIRIVQPLFYECTICHDKLNHRPDEKPFERTEDENIYLRARVAELEKALTDEGLAVERQTEVMLDMKARAEKAEARVAELTANYEKAGYCNPFDCPKPILEMEAELERLKRELAKREANHTVGSNKKVRAGNANRTGMVKMGG